MNCGSIRRVWTAALLAVAMSAGAPALGAAAAAPAIPLGDEAVALLQAYLRIDTTNPPGHELAAAQFFKTIFDREGIESTIYESAPGRANILARLPGDGSRPGLLLLNHMDVVPADARFWAHLPFGGVVEGGFVHGRGAGDMKGMGILELMAMLQLKRSGAKLKGDLVFLATADEEVSGRQGAGFMVAQHADLFARIGAVINEGGFISADRAGRVRYYAVAAAEKRPLPIRLVASGVPGHASLPRPDSSVNRLVRALGRVIAWQPPLQVSDLVQGFYAGIAPLQADAESRDAYRDLRAALADATYAARFSRNVGNRARVSNTLAVTMLEGSNKSNVIPPEASARIDVRLLAGQDQDEFVQALKGVVADDAVRIEAGRARPPSQSPVDGPLPTALQRLAARFHGNAPVAMGVSNGSSDCHYFREIGIPCYGFQPLAMRDGDAGGVHGNDERIRVDALQAGTELMHRLVLEMTVD